LCSHIFYIPFYFQAVKGTTAEGSGIRTIPYLVSLTIASIVGGVSITALGPYAPFMWLGSALFTIGSGLLITLKVDSSAGYWIGYQIVAAIGAGFAIQIPFIAVQVVLNKKDMPSGSMRQFIKLIDTANDLPRCNRDFLQLSWWRNFNLHRPKHLLQHAHQTNP
jgi:hypothetical protein